MPSHIIRIVAEIVVTYIFCAEAEPISLPIADLYVPLTLDGQPLSFRVDSGSARSFAIYGPSYEALMGEGNCGRTRSGCYFCPADNPCDDILSRKRWKTTFGDGDRFEYVEHNMTLIIANKAVYGFKLGLALNYSNVHGKKVGLFGLLGLSFGRSDIPETFLEQLHKRQVISNLMYSIRADGQGPFLNGKLTLDDNSTFGSSRLPLSWQARLYKALLVPLWPLRVLDSDGNLLMRQQGNADVGSKYTFAAALVDTGASALDVSDAELKKIVNITVNAMRRDDRKLYIHNTEQLIWEDTDTGINMIRREAVPYLPTLAYHVGNPPHRMEIRIQPKYFLSECDINSCHLDVSPSPDGSICLGHPLFRAYDVKFDLSSYSVYFSPHGSNSGSVGQPQQDTQPAWNGLNAESHEKKRKKRERDLPLQAGASNDSPAG